MVDFFLVLMLAGAGDELQGIKKGILELADALAINKADGDNVERAKRAAAEYRSALRLFRHTAEWEPLVVTVSALEERGMDDVWRIVEEHRTRLTASGVLGRKRQEQQRTWLWSMIEDGLRAQFLARDEVQRLLPDMEAAVASGRLTPTQAARRLLGAGGAARARPVRRA